MPMGQSFDEMSRTGGEGVRSLSGDRQTVYRTLLDGVLFIQVHAHLTWSQTQRVSPPVPYHWLLRHLM